MAARRHFTAKGFDASGVREIAAEAGVNAALVNRYFSSKEGLFEAAVIPQLHLDVLLQGDRSAFKKRVMELFAFKIDEGAELDPILAFVRSSGSETVGPLLSEAMDKAVIAKMATWLGGANAKQRATLIVAQMLGFYMLYRMTGLKKHKPKQVKDAAEKLAEIVQSIVDGV